MTYKQFSGQKHCQRGLTLVELLVAISILGIIATLGWRGLDSIILARQKIEQSIDQTRELQITFAQLQNDCKSIVGSIELGSKSPITLIPNGFIITRNNFAENSPRNIQLITYKLVDAILYRSASPTTRRLNQIDQFRLDVTKNHTFPAVALNKKVKQIDLALWDKSNKKWVKIDMENSENINNLNNYLDWGGLAFSIRLSNQESKYEITKIFSLGNK